MFECTKEMKDLLKIYTTTAAMSAESLDFKMSTAMCELRRLVDAYDLHQENLMKLGELQRKMGEDDE